MQTKFERLKVSSTIWVNGSSVFGKDGAETRDCTDTVQTKCIMFLLFGEEDGIEHGEK